MIINGHKFEVSGLFVKTYEDDAILRFPSQPRHKVAALVLHETVTRELSTTLRALTARRLGVHLIVAPDGSVTQHADLFRDRLAHAAGLNAASVGLELVTPYYPHFLRPGSPWTEIIPAPWAHGGRYVLPLPCQLEAVARLVSFLTGPESGFLIPKSWPGMTGSSLAMGRVKDPHPRPGIWAHHYVGHADGAFLVLYAWLRFEAGLSPERAFNEARSLATGAGQVIDLSKGRAQSEV